MPEEVRCTKCNKLLYRMIKNGKQRMGYTKEDADVIPSDMINGVIDCKCPRCGEMNTNTVK